MKVGPELDAFVAETFGLGLQPFSTSLGAVWLVEDEIDQRGLSSDYVHALLGIVVPNTNMTVEALGQLIGATPVQRCLAALKVVNEIPVE